MSNFTSKNLVLISNYKHPQKAFKRIVVAFDYEKNSLHFLSQNNQGFISSANNEFSEIPELSAVTISVDENINQPYLEYKPDSLKFIGNGVNIKELLVKAKTVQDYRNYSLSQITTLGNSIQKNKSLKNFMERNSNKEQLQFIKIRNQKVLLDTKYEKPKFLYKHENGQYSHLHIDDVKGYKFMDNNFSGYAVVQTWGENKHKIVALLGDVKIDIEATREEKFIKKCEKAKMQEHEDFQIQCQREDDETKRIILEDLLQRKYKHHPDLLRENALSYKDTFSHKEIEKLIDNEDERLQQQGNSREDSFWGAINNIFAKLYGEKPTLPQVIYFASNIFDLTFEEKSGFLLTVEDYANEMFEIIDDRTLYQIYIQDVFVPKEESGNLLRNSPSTPFKQNVNNQWQNFFKHPDIGDYYKEVYQFDNFKDPLFALNYNKVDIHKKFAEGKHQVY